MKRPWCSPRSLYLGGIAQVDVSTLHFQDETLECFRMDCWLYRGLTSSSPGREGAICGGMQWVSSPWGETVPYEGTVTCRRSAPGSSPGRPAGREPVPLLLKSRPALCHADVLTFYGGGVGGKDYG